MQSSLEKFSFTYYHRVGYAETDKMNFLHHSNYARIYENARWEFFRHIEIPYSKIELSGILMPVVKMDFKFIKPAYYDDDLNIEVNILKLTNTTINFGYIMRNDNNEIINQATTTLAFINEKTGKATRTPEIIKSRFIKEFEFI